MTGPLVNPPASAIGRVNVVLRGRGRRYHVPEFAGPVSIKSVVSGCGTWETAYGAYRLREGSLLVLNDGERYSLTIESEEEAETFCLFFARGFVEGVHAASTLPAGRLLDDPAASRGVRFREVLRPRTDGVGAALAEMRRGLLAQAESLWLEDRFLGAARVLLVAEGEVRRQEERLPSLRAATRAELLRRLHHARDFIDSGLDRKLALSAVAGAACLSPYHFHRLFKAAFGETPHDYIVARRLAHARDLLARTDRPVTEVCLEAGFASLGSFSSLFRRRFGSSPRQYRREGSPARAEPRAGRSA